LDQPKTRINIIAKSTAVIPEGVAAVVLRSLKTKRFQRTQEIIQLFFHQLKQSET